MDTGMRQRGELLERHLDLWRRWYTTEGDPFGSRFIGQVDLYRIGAMGHARGGEASSGITRRSRAHESVRDRRRPSARARRLHPDDDQQRDARRCLPNCDGDVSDLQGVHFFDDSRYNVPGDPTRSTRSRCSAPTTTSSTRCGLRHRLSRAFDDGNSGGATDWRDGAAQHRGAYIVGFFRRYIQNERSIDPVRPARSNRRTSSRTGRS